MIQIDFSGNKIKTKENNGQREIFDVIRKKWLVLTPEEWVRQHMIAYLVSVKEYPASLIAVEKEIRLGALRKRCDVVIYNRELLPWMIIECKEMNTPLSEKTISQILRYHITLPATFLVITNGIYCFGYEKKGNVFNEINNFPDFKTL